MSELCLASQSAVAALETPDYFLAEQRPHDPGKLAFSGRIMLFGGHIEPGENPEVAMRRELSEELALQDNCFERLVELWSGKVDCQNKLGQTVERQVHLFHGQLRPGAKPVLQVPGLLIRVKKDLEHLDSYSPTMTGFTYDAIRGVMEDRLIVAGKTYLPISR